MCIFSIWIQFANIVASDEDNSKFILLESRDYNAAIMKLEPKGCG